MAQGVASLDYANSSGELSDEGSEHQSILEASPTLPDEQQIDSRGTSVRPPHPFRPWVWRDLTAAEREVIENLDRARSSDLSIHLYNASKLKQAARAKVPDHNGFIETKEVPRGWASWPMPPDLVPREHEIRKWEDEDWRIGPYVKREKTPGDELRELMTARILKTAKERLNGRGSADTPEDDQERDFAKPVIIADDDEAKEMLRPSVEYVMAKFNGMLMGLHHARTSYATLRNRRAWKKRPAVPASPSQSIMATEGKNEASVKNSKTLAHSDDDFRMPEDYRTSKKQKRGNSPVKMNDFDGVLGHRGKLGFRDWSDIINMASMTGIDSAAVDRAASRCTDLFGEDMSLRILHKDLREDKNIT